MTPRRFFEVALLIPASLYAGGLLVAISARELSAHWSDTAASDRWLGLRIMLVAWLGLAFISFALEILIHPREPKQPPEETK